jgi:phosphate transport system protein
MIATRHILHHFDEALDALRGDVLMMASLTERNLQNARSCLLDRETRMCAIAIADEEEIDALEKKVDADGVALLLRFQPVASDLRHVISTMKLGGNLERIADQAVKIARRSRKLTMHPALDEAKLLDPMFVLAVELFNDSVRAYAEGDVTLAQSLRVRDRKIDTMNQQIAYRITASIGRHPERVTDYLNLIFIARHIERVGDHAKNIGEDAVYAEAAEDIRHPNNSLGIEGPDLQFS